MQSRERIVKQNSRLEVLLFHLKVVLFRIHKLDKTMLQKTRFENIAPRDILSQIRDNNLKLED